MEDLDPGFSGDLHESVGTAGIGPIIGDLSFHPAVTTRISPGPSATAVELCGDDDVSNLLHEDNLQELMPLGRSAAGEVRSGMIPARAVKSKQRGSGSSGEKATSVPKKRYHCAVVGCQYSTPHAKDLARHMRKHTGEKPYKCPKCAKSFSRYDKLKIHALTHDGIRPYKCTFCTYASSDSGSLRKHVRIHTNERPHKCHLCSYQARDSSQLVIHLRHHTGDTPYVCTHEGCKSAFKTPSDLQRHTRLHTGEKPYGCPHCPYRAAVKCNLSVHIRKVHQTEKKVRGSNKNELTATLATEAQTDVVSSSSCSRPANQDCPQSMHLPIEDGLISDGISGGRSDVFGAAAPKDDYVSNSNTYSDTPKTDPPGRASRKRNSRPKNERLPFQYACKSCPVKCDTMKAFRNHVMQMHKDINLGTMAKSVQEEAKSVIVSPGAAKWKVMKTNVAKLFECNHCPAAFAAEESLKCHLKQHSPKTITSVGVPPHVDLGNNTSLMAHSNHCQSGPFSSFASQRPPDLPVIVRSETTVIAGQTQQVYVIVRNSSVPEKPDAKTLQDKG